MRDPNRIPVIMERLRKLWEQNPDLRLAQLIGNVFPAKYSDPYYMEDEDFVGKMEKDYER